jgi:hypothetical protein
MAARILSLSPELGPPRSLPRIPVNREITANREELVRKESMALTTIKTFSYQLQSESHIHKPRGNVRVNQK